MQKDARGVDDPAEVGRLAGFETTEGRFEQSFGGGRGPGGGRERGSNMRPGQVWILENDAPRRVRVLTGLSDDQFTEIASDELGDGDAVIVRLAR